MVPYEAYIATCFVTASSWAYIGQKWTTKTLFLVVFFPGIFVAWFGNEATFPSRALGFGKFDLCLQFCVLGGFLAMGAIALCLLINWICGWGTIDERTKLEEPTNNLLTTFLCTAAEEIGWRCYLLPHLVQDYSPLIAIFISATITGLYHMPNSLVMAYRYEHPKPVFSVFLVFIHRFLMSFPMSWLAVRTGYRLWSPLMLLLTWSRINPVTTGNLYTNKGAKISGPLWLVSGQGVAGCLGFIPIFFFTIYQLLYRLN